MRISDWSSDVCSSDLDRPLQRPHGALKLRRLLTADLHAQGGPDLTHTLKGRLLGGNDGIDLPHAEIGQKVGLVDRTLGVPDIRSEERRGGEEGVSTCRSRW